MNFFNIQISIAILLMTLFPWHTTSGSLFKVTVTNQKLSAKCGVSALENVGELVPK